jgi:O-antigen ligase
MPFIIFHLISFLNIRFFICSQLKVTTGGAINNIKHRLKTVVWEIVLYRQTGYLTATSVTQRLEFWRAGINIIRENLWFGTGTGDIDNAFKQMYPKMKSQLPPDQWWRTHNQYLTVFATLGIFGFLLFIFAMVWPGIKLNMYKDYFFLVFFCYLHLEHAH